MEGKIIPQQTLPRVRVRYCTKSDAGSQINDDGFLHALRVYRDAISGAVRLQSSVHNGEMKRYIGLKNIRLVKSSTDCALQSPCLDGIHNILH